MPYIVIHRLTSRLKFAFVIFRNSYYPNKYIGPSSILPRADCMSFPYNYKTLRSGNSCNLRTQSKISTHGDENTGEAEMAIIESSEENRIRFSPELVDERIKASFESLPAQISALTEMMDRLIRSNSTKESETVSSRGFGHQYKSPYSERPGSSRFPTVASLTTAGFLPDTCHSTVRPIVEYESF